MVYLIVIGILVFQLIIMENYMKFFNKFIILGMIALAPNVKYES